MRSRARSINSYLKNVGGCGSTQQYADITNVMNWAIDLPTPEPAENSSIGQQFGSNE